MKPIRYWDANAFLGWFNDEAGRANLCENVLALAEEGKLLIVTSAITLTEVIRLEGKPRLKPEQEETIRKFFEREYIIVRNVDRVVAERARQLIWEHSFLRPKDSIHIATALELKIPILDTFDDDLLKLDGKLGNPVLRIGKPNLAYQGDLGLSKKSK